MAELVYIACGIMSVVCALTLYRQYRRSPSSMLLWSSLCFAILAASNLFLVVDMVLMPDVDLGGTVIRNFLTMVAGMLLLFGLIMELT